MKKETIGYIILVTLALAAAVEIFLIPPILQDESYHLFSDKDTLLGIPNFWNVVSNIPFLIVGAIGIFKVWSLMEIRIQYILFFLGISFVGLGSAYYHLDTNSETLIWDRLPMTLAFMALSSIVISEFLNDKIGKLLLAPLLFLGILSIAVWISTKDLRFYALVQFYPMLAIPVVLIFFRSNRNSSKTYWLLLIAYIIAKLFEHFDQEIHHLVKVISGHTLKHVMAAIGIYAVVKGIQEKKKEST